MRIIILSFLVLFTSGLYGQEKKESLLKIPGAARVIVKLVKVDEINYGGLRNESGMVQVEREHSYAAPSAGDGSMDYNFTPDDLIFRDTISFDWLIEEK